MLEVSFAFCLYSIFSFIAIRITIVLYDYPCEKWITVILFTEKSLTKKNQEHILFIKAKHFLKA